MKLDFGSYVYFGNPNRDYKNNDDYKFNAKTFNDFLANREYIKAADYAEQYHFTDPTIQAQHEAYIESIRSNGRVLGAIYSKINNPDQMEAVEFFDKVFANDGLSSVNPDNYYYKRFREYKNALGSANGTIAEKLSVTFAPEKQSLFGIDLFKRDNDNNIDNFYTKSGLSKNLLEEAGVKFDEKDGYTTLTFDKSNDFANKIIYNLSNSGGIPVTIKGYDIKGNELGDNDSKYYVNSFKDSPYEAQYLSQAFHINGKTFVGRGGRNYTNQGLINEIGNIIDSTKTAKQAIFEESKLDNIEQSTILCGYISTQIEDLERRKNAGLISREDYKEMKSELTEKYDLQLRGLAGSQYKMYTNYHGLNDDTETMLDISDDTSARAELMNFVSQRLKSGRVNYQVAINGEDIGTLITVDADEKDNSKEGQKRVSIFVPQLFEKEAQERVNRNTIYRAAAELNKMEIYDYIYDTAEGNKIGVTIDEAGNRYFYEKDGTTNNIKEISRDEALRQMNKSMIMDSLAKELRYRYTNNRGELIDEDTMKAELKHHVTKSINELYPEVMQLTPDNIFKDSIIKDENGNDIIDDKNINFSVYNKVSKAYDMYLYILNQILSRYGH